MHVLGKFAYFVSKKHQDIINVNLAWAFGNRFNEAEKKQIGISAFTNLIDTVFGIVKRDSMSKEDVLRKITFEGEEIIQAYKDTGKQFILVTGHFGNWELLSQSIAIYFDLTLVGVGRKLDSEKMDEVLRSNRERFNVEMVYKNGAIKSCIKAIGQKKIVGILTDQSLSIEQSVDVTFFGHKTTHTPIASILSRKFGLDLIPAFISTEDYINYTVNIYSPIKTVKTDNKEKDLADLTQKQADSLEQVIREKPTQWFWMHKRWKAYNPKLYEY
jgi:KDO2-lipid IV(A) lauroyltransferase